MNKKKYVPIDLPRDLEFLMDNFDDNLKAKINEITQNALDNGRWRASEDVPFNPTDIEFIAYWMQKTRGPLREAMKGYGIEEKLSPYKKLEFDWKPMEFDVEKVYRLSAVGDLMFAKYIEESKDRLYNDVEELIFGADYAYANLESTLSADTPKEFEVKSQGETPHINITKNQYEALVKHNDKKYDVVQLANNHILDCGEEGISVTINQLNQDKIEFLGVYETEAKSNEVKYTMLDNIKIGWVAHTFGVNGKSFPEDKPWICDMTPFHIEKDPQTVRIEQQILKAREAGCDLVFVTLHWGLEHEFYPHPDQIAWAHKFAEVGADAIIAHHPHVIQPVEIYKPKNDCEKSVPILYSLGNLTPAYGSAATVLSLIANFSISKGHLNGVNKTMITGLKLTPVAFMGEKDNNEDYASIVPLDVLDKSNMDSKTRDYVNEIKEYADLILGDSWRKGI